MKMASFFALFAGMTFFAALTSPHTYAQDPRSLFQAEKGAVGGEAWKEIVAIRFNGRLIAGDAPGTFTELIDHHTGHSLMVVDTGSLHDEYGFDGAIWNKQNGMVTVADLPALLADAETQAFVNRDGWWRESDVSELKLLPSQTDAKDLLDRIQVTPDKGTAIDVWLDSKTHLIVKLVAHADAGDQTTTYSDWRQIGDIRLPFRQVQTDERGATTTLEVISASVEKTLPPNALTHPGSQAHGTIQDEQKRDAQGAGSSTVPFRLTGVRGHIIVPATINGKAATLLFDSGAANYFPPGSARRFGLVVSGGVNLGGVGGGSTTGGYAKVEEISIGRAKLHDEAVMIGPLPYTAVRPEAGVVIDGLTGFEFLSEFRTTIDYAKRILTFSSFEDDPKPAGVTESYFSDGHDIYVKATIDGASGLFRVDTGDHETVSVFRTFADKQHLFEGGGTVKVSSGGVGGTLPTHEFADETFILGDTKFTHIPVSVSDTRTGSFASRSLAGNLGTGILSRFCITFDYRAHTVTFLPNPNANAPFQSDKSGLSVTQNNSSELTVLSVRAGSAAGAAGILAGDAIVGVDGTSVTERQLGVYDLEPFFYGAKDFELTIRRGDKTLRITVSPR